MAHKVKLNYYAVSEGTDQFALVIQIIKRGKRNIQGVPQSQAAALPRHQEEQKKDKTEHAQIEQTY